MTNLKLDPELNQKIVDGILSGYKSYLAERKRASEMLKISDAYAWTRGNHVDSNVWEQCQSLENVSCTDGKAGRSWRYLQITLNSNNKKYLILVKNATSAKNTFDAATADVNKDNYLFGFARANNHLVQDGELKGHVAGQMSLDLEGQPNQSDLTEFEAQNGDVAQFDRFYIVTYDTDENKMIKNIYLTVPNQQKMTLYIADDLTAYIEKSNVEISEEELAAVKNDRIPESTYSNGEFSFGYEVPAKREETDDQDIQNG